MVDEAAGTEQTHIHPSNQRRVRPGLSQADGSRNACEQLGNTHPRRPKRVIFSLLEIQLEGHYPIGPAMLEE
jgi:hypothetical protein